jgi:hypothetical protein
VSKILVIGVDHFLQKPGSLCATPSGKESETKQKKALRARLEALIAEHKVELVAEEAELHRDCLGKQLASAHACRYCNLTMPLNERAKCNIEKDYNKTSETRESAYRVFEAFMFRAVQDARQEATGVLVLCGLYHMNHLAELFSETDEEVIVEDTTQASWYRGRPWESGGKMLGFRGEDFERKH